MGIKILLGVKILTQLHREDMVRATVILTTILLIFLEFSFSDEEDFDTNQNMGIRIIKRRRSPQLERIMKTGAGKIVWRAMKRGYQSQQKNTKDHLLIL